MGKMFSHSAGPNRFLRYEVDTEKFCVDFIFAPVGRERGISLSLCEIGKIVSESAKRPIGYYSGAEQDRSDVKYTGLAEIQSGFFVRVSRLREVEVELVKARKALILENGHGRGGIHY